MAPSLAKADEVYSQAVGRLRTACILLERHLPSVDPTEVQVPPGPPNLRPSQRDVVVPPCADCELELEGIEPENRGEHQCSHRPDDIGVPADDEPGTPVVRAPRRGHPNPGVVRMEVSNLDAKFDVFAGATSTVISLVDTADQRMWERHLLIWTEYYGWMKDRADELLDLIETANTVAANTLVNVNIQTNATRQDSGCILGRTQVLGAALQGARSESEHEENPDNNNEDNTEDRTEVVDPGIRNNENVREENTEPLNETE